MLSHREVYRNKEVLSVIEETSYYEITFLF